MQLLAFDTSGPVIQIAVQKDDKLLFQDRIAPQDKSRQESASQLVPAIDRALKAAGMKKSELDLIVVGVGPGSFTGVRVAVVTARTLGQTMKLAVMPVSSLEMLASRLMQETSLLLSAGGGKYFAAAYDGTEFVNEVLKPICASMDELEEYLRGSQKIAAEAGISLPQSIYENKLRLELPLDFNYAAEAARLAYKRIEKSGLNASRAALAEAYPWDNVLPLYLRSPSVTLKTNGSSDKSTSR